MHLSRLILQIFVYFFAHGRYLPQVTHCTMFLLVGILQDIYVAQRAPAHYTNLTYNLGRPQFDVQFWCADSTFY